jgi:putative transposase
VSKYRLVEAERAEHSISRLCKVLGVTRQGFHAWRRRGPSLRQLGDDELKGLIVTIYDGSLQTYGAPRVQLDLADQHVHVGRKRVARLMRQLGLQGSSGREGKRPRTTVPDGKTPPAPDLVERHFQAEAPNRLWLADITYVPTLEGWLFLAVVEDMFSRKIVGWSMRDDLKADLVVDALAMAVTRRKPPAGVVFHSDRGTGNMGRWRSAGRSASRG